MSTLRVRRVDEERDEDVHFPEQRDPIMFAFMSVPVEYIWTHLCEVIIGRSTETETQVGDSYRKVTLRKNMIRTQAAESLKNTIQSLAIALKLSKFDETLDETSV